MSSVTFRVRFPSTPAIAALVALALAGCAQDPLPEAAGAGVSNYDYIMGPGDVVDVFVWRNPEVSAAAVPVRPDGRLSTPLVEDMTAAGKTPAQLARDIESVLAKYVREPLVTITVRQFVGDYHDQVRVVGEAAQPRAMPYRQALTLLDVMITVGGLTEFAAGNKATLVRRSGETTSTLRVRLDDLLKDGDISANVAMRPGDVLVIPEALF